METPTAQSTKSQLSDNDTVADEVMEMVCEYYRIRNYKWPTMDEALYWFHSEIGEVYELLLAKSGGWVRNNPNDHPPYSDEHFEEELGDGILMLLVTGRVSGVNPLRAMFSKMVRKSGMSYKLSVVKIAHQLSLNLKLSDCKRFSFGLWIVRLGCKICGLQFKITKLQQ